MIIPIDTIVPKIRVLLADDHPALRVGLRVLLEQASDVEVVGDAGDGREALDRIEELRPDVAVLDCQLPEIQGTEVAAEIRRRGLATRVLALSAYRDEKYVRGMMKAGAVGYLLKDEAPRVIVAAVQAAARGESWFSPEVAAKVAAWQRGELSEQPDLTEREMEVLQLVAKGKSNKEIAYALNVTERTIEFHVGNILSKLGVASRVEAAMWARDRGIDS
ncbi:MAG: response regulator transcription factor [Dehalococcoidales bacterium]|nr:response regulator transcription factor [Dehalococcoidales bacterium]